METTGTIQLTVIVIYLCANGKIFERIWTKDTIVNGHEYRLLKQHYDYFIVATNYVIY